MPRIGKVLNRAREAYLQLRGITQDRRVLFMDEDSGLECDCLIAWVSGVSVTYYYFMLIVLFAVVLVVFDMTARGSVCGVASRDSWKHKRENGTVDIMLCT